MSKTKIINIKQNFGLRDNYQRDLEKLKESYFKKVTLAYVNLCFFCNEEPTVFPTVSKNIYEIVMEQKTMPKILGEMVKYIKNYDEYLEKIFLEIERLEKKAKGIMATE